MHRLMLGVSFNNCNIMPWVENFMVRGYEAQRGGGAWEMLYSD